MISNFTMMDGKATLPSWYITSLSALAVTKSGPSSDTAPYVTTR